MIGFCLVDQQDIPIDADGRCLTHGTRTLPPSTGCCHQRWANGAWSACDPQHRNTSAKPCKPVAVGTWRTALDGKRVNPTRQESEQKKNAARFGMEGEHVTRQCRWCKSIFIPKVDQTKRNFCSDAHRRLDREARTQQWHPRHVSCCDCHQTTLPFYRFGRCRPCFDAWHEAQQCRQVAS